MNIVNPFHFSFSVLDVLEEKRAHKYSFTDLRIYGHYLSPEGVGWGEGERVEGEGGKEAEDFDCASIKNFLIRQKALYKML